MSPEPRRSDWRRFTLSRLTPGRVYDPWARRWITDPARRHLRWTDITYAAEAAVWMLAWAVLWTACVVGALTLVVAGVHHLADVVNP